MKKRIFATTATAIALLCGVVSAYAASADTSAYTSASASSGTYYAKYTTGGWVAWDNYSFTASTGSSSGSVYIHAKDKGDEGWENRSASGSYASASYGGGTWATNTGSYAYAGSARVNVTTYN